MDMQRLKQYISLYLIVIFCGITICIYAPYDMYLANRSEFWFSLYNFWWMPIVFGIAAILCGILVGLLLKRWPILERIYESAVFGVALCLYLQGSFLNLDVGVANGSAVDWDQYRSKMLLNVLIWAVIIVGVIVAAIKKWDICRKVIMCISMFFSATQLISFVFLLIMNVEEFTVRPDTTFLSKEGLFEVSEEENIIVFLMDAFDDSYMKEIIEEEPAVVDELEGFIYFSNNTGSYPSTLYAAQYLLSGYYNLNEAPFSQWRAQLDDKPMYWDDLDEAGWDYYIYEDSSLEVPTRIYKAAENYSNVPLKIGNYFSFVHDLYQFVACRYFPDIVKPYIWLDGSEFADSRVPEYGEYEAFSYYNADFLEDMASNPVIAKEDGKFFKFIHLEGCHGPNRLNENGEIQEEPVSEKESAKGCLKIIENLLRQMKKLGCYDNSAVIIMADHGYSKDGVLTNPVFLVKPQNASGSLQISNAPVSHKDYPATLMALAGEDEMVAKYGESVFDIGEGETRERFFYQYYYENELKDNTLRLIEYRIDPESNAREWFHLTDVEYTVEGEKIQHSKYCQLCKTGGITPEQLEEYDPPREIHEKADNYPVK